MWSLLVHAHHDCANSPNATRRSANVFRIALFFVYRLSDDASNGPFLRGTRCDQRATRYTNRWRSQFCLSSMLLLVRADANHGLSLSKRDPLFRSHPLRTVERQSAVSLPPPCRSNTSHQGLRILRRRVMLSRISQPLTRRRKERALWH